MPPINQNKIVIQTTPRARSNSIEQTTALMKLKIFQNRLHMIMNTSKKFQNLSRHMIKLISTGSYIVFMDTKFYRHGYMTKLELHKNSQNFQSKETIYHN